MSFAWGSLVRNHSLSLSLSCLAVAGCSSNTVDLSPPVEDAAPPTDTAPGSCQLADRSCTDYTGAMYTASSTQTACDFAGGTEIAAPCPSAHRVGSCLFDAGKPSEQTVRYYSPAFTVDTAQSSCTAVKGTFTPG